MFTTSTTNISTWFTHMHTHTLIHQPHHSLWVCTDMHTSHSVIFLIFLKEKASKWGQKLWHHNIGIARMVSYSITIVDLLVYYTTYFRPFFKNCWIDFVSWYFICFPYSAYLVLHSPSSPIAWSIILLLFSSIVTVLYNNILQVFYHIAF